MLINVLWLVADAVYPYPQAALGQGGDQGLPRGRLAGAADHLAALGAGDGVAAAQGGQRADPVESRAQHGEAMAGETLAFGHQAMEALLGELMTALAGRQQLLG